VSYEVSLSHRAAKDLDRLNPKTKTRILNRLDEIAEAPLDPRLSSMLTNQSGLRRARVGGWRIIFELDNTVEVVRIVTIDRRGQDRRGLLYHRI
jgi:mRNA-degrading endonuclease RelE of RelBE toxin-antitoxin system